MHFHRAMRRIAATVLVLCAGLVPATAQTIRYVDDDAGAGGDGQSWSMAYRYLQDALAEAAQPGSTITEIRVAQGTYKPDQGAGRAAGDRTATFRLTDGVALKGGYAGIAQPDPDERDIEEQRSVLSGDLGGNDAETASPLNLLTESTRSENSFHVVTGSDLTSSTLLEGFTVRSGHVDRFASVKDGAGLLLQSASPVIRRCVFTLNSGTSESTDYSDGGALACIGNSGPVIQDCVFVLNATVANGGAWSAVGSTGIVMERCAFEQNRSSSGGAVYLRSVTQFTMRQCTLHGNTGRDNDGRDGDGGAIYSYQSEYTLEDCDLYANYALRRGGALRSSQDIQLTITGTRFSHNVSAEGGAIYSLLSDMTVTGSIFVANYATSFGGGLRIDRNSDGGVEIRESLILENRAAQEGAGLYVSGDSFVMDRCRIQENVSSWRGGAGIHLNGSHAFISNCIVSGNRVLSNSEGAAIRVRQGHIDLVHCTIAHNSGDPDNGGMGGDDATSTILNSIIYHNSSPSIDTGSLVATIEHSNIEGMSLGGTNIDADPLLGESSILHLMSGSPCIDTGTKTSSLPLPTVDLVGQNRSQDGDGDTVAVPDMGAHEANLGPMLIASKPVIQLERSPGDKAVFSDTLDLRNGGVGSFDWQASVDSDWLRLSPESGTLAETGQTLTLDVDASLLTPGPYTAQLEITTTNGLNDTLVVPVHLYLGKRLNVPGSYATIQEAINVARQGDVVQLAEGTFTGSGNTYLSLYGKAITLRGSDNPEACIIDGEGSHLPFRLRDGESNDTVITGLTIRRGYHLNRGGGVFCDGSSPTIRNVIIMDCEARDTGGGIHLESSKARIEDCLIQRNRGYQGGGIYCSESEPTIVRCRILDNLQGSGIRANYSRPTISDCIVSGHNSGGINLFISDPQVFNTLIVGNSADGDGGGIYSLADVDQEPTFVNCVISHNSATSGGGVYVKGLAEFVNCTLTANQAVQYGGAIYLNKGNVSVHNSAVWNNHSGLAASNAMLAQYHSMLAISHCNVKQAEVFVDNTSTLAWQDGNVEEDPLFVDPDGPDNYIPSWEDNDYRLQVTSPCIDAGSNEAVPDDASDLDGDQDTNEQTPLDFDHEPRFRDHPEIADTGSGTAPVVDIGAYEFYLDCNDNGIWDPDEIAAGSPDINGNGVPDECDPDCNDNGVLDDLDLANGTSKDVNQNGIPDECEDNVPLVTNLRTSATHLTIQQAIDAAAPGDVLEASPAIYTGAGNKDLDFHGKAITLRSTDPGTPSVVAATVIDCEGAGRGFLFQSGETASTVISGLTIVNGLKISGYKAWGGGILCDNNSSPSITNCIFRHCSSYDGGGVACVLGSSPLITGCTFQENEAVQTNSSGGGIHCIGDSNPVISQCTFIGNRASGRGGGAYFQYATASISDSDFVENSANSGTGIASWGSTVTVDGCSIALNGFEGKGVGIWLSNQTDFMISDSTISNNGAGGMYADESTVTIVRCSITHHLGSGLHATDSTLKIAEAFIAYNKTPPYGGGINLLGGVVQIVNSSVVGNEAGYAGGGINAVNLPPGSFIANCRVAENKAQFTNGGGIASGNSALAINGCTVWNNTAARGGGVFTSYSGDLMISNSILWGNTAKEGPQIAMGGDPEEPSRPFVMFSDIEGGQGAVFVDPDYTLIWGDGNLDADPLFIDPDGSDDDPATWEDNNYRLAAGSPCVDAGNNDLVPSDTADLDEDGDTTEPTPFDLDGHPRFVNDLAVPDTGVGIPAVIVDMGAYERYDCNGNDTSDDKDIDTGTSPDVNLNDVPDECDPDCNGNGVPDDLDIANGTSLDCDGNARPDECDPDCNENGIPDACDIAEGYSEDCNTNGMADECEPQEDCNDNGIQDICDIAAMTSSDCNNNGIPDKCEFGYHGIRNIVQDAPIARSRRRWTMQSPVTISFSHRAPTPETATGTLSSAAKMSLFGARIRATLRWWPPPSSTARQHNRNSIVASISTRMRRRTRRSWD